jgi:hypothetical protein
MADDIEAEKQQPLNNAPSGPAESIIDIAPMPVSYTHLRAHET